MFSTTSRYQYVDRPEEVEDEDPVKEEVVVVDVEDTPNATKKKKRRNPLTCQKLSAIISRRWVTLLVRVMHIKGRKAKKRKSTFLKKPKKNRP